MSSQIVSYPCPFVRLREEVAHPSRTQAFVEPTDDDEMHLMCIVTTKPNPVAGARKTSVHSLQLSHPHTDECALCAATVGGESPGPVAPAVNDKVPRKYRSLLKAVLFPCFLLLCANMLSWEWSIMRSFLRSRGVFDADFAAHTSIKELRAEVQFFGFSLLGALAILYLEAW